MKKRVLALAALSALIGAAHADITVGDEHNSLTFYGTLDIGVGMTNHSYSEDPNSASGNSAMANNGVVGGRLISLLPSSTTPSKWGFKGQRTLENGRTAGFVLESQVDVNTGTNPNGRISDSLPGAGSAFNKGEGSIQGQMFDREASVWMQDANYGLFKLGRMTTTLGDSMASYDPMSVGYAVSPLGMNGGWGAGAYTGDSRWDNTVKWSNSYGPIKAGLQYKFGGYTQGYTMGTAESFKLAYETEKFGLSFNVQNTLDTISAGGATLGNGLNGTTSGVLVTNTSNCLNSNTGANAAGVSCSNNITLNGLNLTVADARAVGLFGRYNLNDQLMFKSGFELVHLTNPSNASNYTVGNVGQISSLSVNSINTNPFGSYGGYLNQKMVWLGANYKLDGKSTVTGAFYKRLDNYANGQGAQANYWSGKYEYAMDANTVLYATGIVSTVNTNAAVTWVTGTTQIPTTITYTGGVVYRF